ncbi:MAG TPA: cold shock domain-containing protein, partial [Solirubrobacteraceae bacterium]|nr:cold shock domain-containing protein [Solirubrobacteraceae bacterium]
MANASGYALIGDRKPLVQRLFKPTSFVGVSLARPCYGGWRFLSEYRLRGLRFLCPFFRGGGGVCMATGTVKWFNDAKGYGFITPADG